jgi:hypothetical protein
MRYVSHRAQAEQTIVARVFQVMAAAGYLWEREAKILTPVDTGLARSSVRMEIERHGHRIVVTVGSNVIYFIWIEIGTRGRPGAAPLARSLPVAVAAVRRGLQALGMRVT